MDEFTLAEVYKKSKGNRTRYGCPFGVGNKD
jgi:hypothetical protein